MQSPISDALSFSPQFLTRIWEVTETGIETLLTAKCSLSAEGISEQDQNSNFQLAILQIFRPGVLGSPHRLNMEVDLQSLFGLHGSWCAQLYSFAETPQLPPSPCIWTRITRALLVRKDRRHIFVTPWQSLCCILYCTWFQAIYEEDPVAAIDRCKEFMTNGTFQMVRKAGGALTLRNFLYLFISINSNTWKQEWLYT